ncbi:fibroleukin-like [Paramormyrops kingsleyae]|uniref:fibroleukin-like n=1 Tax=Paramormyrops kingsleyae TaxID=1676925 RepID=UPI003B978E30
MDSSFFQAYLTSLLLLLAAQPEVLASTLGGEQEDSRSATCSLKLQPAGDCEDGDTCPFQVSLPPLAIQLPKQFSLLEKTLKDLQSLRAEVDQLRAVCLECHPQADQRDGGVTPAPGSYPSSFLKIKDPQDATRLQEMQTEMTELSTSLKDAHAQIDTLRNSLDDQTQVYMKNVEDLVNGNAENISRLVTQLNNKCPGPCPAQGPQPIMVAPRDCSDFSGHKTKSDVYQVMPDLQRGMFDVYCDMESYGGGWTVVQRRLDGTVRFNRSWEEYKQGFGDLRGEFWLGNDNIHLLTKSKDMVLRIELEDLNTVREYAKYDHFYVANEYLNYRLSIGGYSGTAGDAMHYGKNYNHDHKFFTTPDRDNDMYSTGNCGAYYSSGWWFDACMSANLNGKYYKKKYKGVRNGIFWSTWRNVTTEPYLTGYRQAFKSVKMMIRPKNYSP